ncbi:MAG TPA: class I SAM-dependent methyltransferase [Blastocatellia bacterium]|nr:class I SAM-dependent methyltransferase [Blastocatellia bacterium]
MVRAMFAPITSALIEAAAIEEGGDSVLDVAGGSGEPSITIAEAVGPSASVIFTDAVAEMVVASRSQARHRRLTNIEFTQCVGEALPFSTGTFDVVVCRLGVMLFPDPAAAIREMLRVVKPAGRVALAVWNARDSNPFFYVVANIVSRYVESPPEDPDAPGAFRFAGSGKLAGLLRDAGAIEVTERLLKFSIDAPLEPKQFWEVRTELSDTLRAKVAALSSEQVARMAQEVEEAGRAFYDAGRMRFPAEVLIVSGRRDVA